MDELVQLLREQPLLHHIALEEVEELASYVTEREVEKDTIIYEQGDPVSYGYEIVNGKLYHLEGGDQQGYVYMVAEGELEILERSPSGQTRINLLFPGELCGDTALLDARQQAEEHLTASLQIEAHEANGQYEVSVPQPVTVRALVDSTLLAMPGAHFLALYDAHPSVRRHVNRLGAEMEHRARASFDGQAPGEIVISISRRHPLALAQSILPFVLIYLFLGCGVLSALSFVLRANANATQQLITLGSISLLIPALYVLWQSVDWWNDYFIVTSRRVIHIERVWGLLLDRDEVPMEKIQNVNFNQIGPISKLLGFGQILVATAAGKGGGGTPSGTIVMDFIPNAERLAQRIIQEQNRAKSVTEFMAKAEKRANLRRALGLESEPLEIPPNSELVPPPPPSSSRFGPLRKLIHYLRPTTREEDGNQIIWRRHWFSVLWRSLPAYIGLVTFLAAAAYFGFEAPLTPLEDRFLVIGAFVGFLFIVGWITWLYDDWRNDRYILTPEAIVDEDRWPLGFRSSTRRAQLANIQDIKLRQNNPFLVWANIGDVVIQTAGQEGSFTFNFVHRPREVQEEINQAIQNLRSRQGREQMAAMNRDMTEMFELYDEIRREEERKQGRGRTLPPSSSPEATTAIRQAVAGADATSRPVPPAESSSHTATTRVRTAPPETPSPTTRVRAAPPDSLRTTTRVRAAPPEEPPAASPG